MLATAENTVLDLAGELTPEQEQAVLRKANQIRARRKELRHAHQTCKAPKPDAPDVERVGATEAARILRVGPGAVGEIARRYGVGVQFGGYSRPDLERARRVLDAEAALTTEDDWFPADRLNPGEDNLLVSRGGMERLTPEALLDQARALGVGLRGADRPDKFGNRRPEINGWDAFRLAGVPVRFWRLGGLPAAEAAAATFGERRRKARELAKRPAPAPVA